VARELDRTYYPGLNPQSVDLWRWWLKDHEHEFHRYEYNVLVGEGVTATAEALAGDPALSAKITAAFKRSTQRRIDVVGYKARQVWILEIEWRPGMRALGQSIAYPHLLAPLVDPKLMILRAFIAEEMSNGFTIPPAPKPPPKPVPIPQPIPRPGPEPPPPKPRIL
jgi:hypothetical protein